MLELRTKADLQRLVDEGLEEGLTLDYKASPALSRESTGINELCKDVSAFANSAGGQIIYGIEDSGKGKPSRVDDGVVDPKITREWIEQILNSRIQPRMTGVRTERYELSPGRYGYAITIPPTRTGPHQAPDLKYYRRFDLQSVAMQDYEIRDVMARTTTPAPQVTLSFTSGNKHSLEFAERQDVSKSFPFNAHITNNSAQPAYHVIVDIGLDTDIIVTSSGQFAFTGRRPDKSNIMLNWYRRILSSPPNLPVFKENVMALADTQFNIAFNPASMQRHPLVDLTVLVVAPGFSSEDHWAILNRGSQVMLYPPNTPYTIRDAKWS